jgi:anaerobic magnesium-protoporphyrin IX monomethyl ester cyclase
MKSNILLINPPWILHKGDQDFFRISQPDGLGYIAASLEKNGHSVKLLDAASTGWRQKTQTRELILAGMTYPEILAIIKSYKPNLIGISMVSSLFKNNGYKLAEIIKLNFKQIPIIVGGAHPSVAYLECLNTGYIDIAVVGEGEITVCELVDEMVRNKPNLHRIKGIVYKNKNKLIVTEKRPFITDLDKLPYPARKYYPMDDYFMASKKLLSSFAISTYNHRWANMITSRGCPYGCVFCSINLSMGQKWRGRSAENVMSEIKLLINTYKVDYISFLDDNMSFVRSRMQDICDLIIQNNLKFKWSTPNGLRADTLDEPLLLKMKKAGCHRIAVAPESGSQRVINQIIGKRLKLEQVEKIVRICKKIGLDIDCFFVIGLYGETKNEIQQTLEYAKYLKKIGASAFNFALATPFIGTRFYQQLLGKGLIRPDFNEFTYFRRNAIIETPEYNAKDITEFLRLADKINFFPIDYIKFIFFLLIRDPERFFRILIKQFNFVFRNI